MIWTNVQEFMPFRIDALGIVTILGAAEVDRVIGRLLSPCITDFLPLLGAFVIASDAISAPVPGYRLYNIDDGIVAYDVTPWFARWLLTQTLTRNSTYMHIDVAPSPSSSSRSRRWWHRSQTPIGLALGAVALVPLFVVCVFSRDWWGFANAASMLISVVVRWVVVRGRAEGVRRAWASVAGERWAREPKKLLVLTPDGKALTVYAPCAIVRKALLVEKKVPRPLLDTAVRMLGWLGFGTHVVTLGMSNLVDQLITIVVLIVGTVVVLWDVGADRNLVCGAFRISRFDEPNPKTSRSRTYHRLDLTPDEEETLIAWGLFPPVSNKKWWEKYRTGQADTDRTLWLGWKKEVGLLPSVNKLESA